MPELLQSKILALANFALREYLARCCPISTRSRTNPRHRRRRRSFAALKTSWPAPWLSGAEDFLLLPTIALRPDRKVQNCQRLRLTNSVAPPTQWYRNRR